MTIFETIFDAPPADPIVIFDQWLAEAIQTEANDPDTTALATVSPDGMPNVRMVLLKSHDGDGFVFYTNLQSTKGDELAQTAKAAMCFHWKSLRRQVRVQGPVGPVSDEMADAYYQSRSRASRIGAWASQQSRPLNSRAGLEEDYAHYDRQYAGDDIPRPPYWTGQRIVPLRIEFWQDGAHRLHDRVAYHRPTPSASWHAMRLHP